jgi:3-phosphoshikimate 1-carboxyvinyltransferase
MSASKQTKKRAATERRSPAPAAMAPAAPGPAKALLSRRVPAFGGETRVPGDKSISHRALILGALAVGETTIEGLLESADVMATLAALERLGVDIERADGLWRVFGAGVGGLGEAARPLDLGNSGTSVRLLMGVAAEHPFTTFFTGDPSLCARPMARVIEPLERMGASVVARSGGRLPLALRGPERLLPVSHRLAVPSAQVKSAILLAGLNAPGETSVIEAAPTRDHTELMLRHFGAPVGVEAAEGETRITLEGEAELKPQAVAVPGDVSSAAFPLAAALMVPEGDLTLENVGLNPRRSGLIETLGEMGAAIEVQNARSVGGEAVADLRVRSSALTGVEVPPERAPRMIDEYPVLAALAACAKGPTAMRGLAELRVKESDRLRAIAEGLSACGVALELVGDDLIVEGAGRPPKGGATVESRFDHRIAMAFLTLGLVADEPVGVDDGSMIETSFPDFCALMNRLGADIGEA